MQFRLYCMKIHRVHLCKLTSINGEREKKTERERGREREKERERQKEINA